MIAWLGMYDMPHARPALDRLWQAFRLRWQGAPDLSRDGDVWEIWQSPDLLLAQTCGLPYRARLQDRVTLVGTPDHGLPDAPAGHYYSVLIARRDDDRDLAGLARGVMAYNEGLSQSGWAAPLGHLSDRGLAPGKRAASGAHAASAQAVAHGDADFAGIDVVTWRMLAAEEPELTAQLRVVDRTRPTPALPFITAKGTDPAPIVAALAQAISDISASDRDTLHLHGLVRIEAEEYCALPIPPAP